MGFCAWMAVAAMYLCLVKQHKVKKKSGRLDTRFASKRQSRVIIERADQSLPVCARLTFIYILLGFLINLAHGFNHHGSYCETIKKDKHNLFYNILFEESCCKVICNLWWAPQKLLTLFKRQG